MTLNLAGINARSIKFGWNLGLSKAEGIADVTETTVNSLEGATYEVDAEVVNALNSYYAGLSTIEDERFKNYKVSEDNLAAMIASGEDYYLLSVRSAEDYAKGHIQGAFNVPYGKELYNNLGSVPMDKKVVVYCYTGQTAGQATADLRLLGFDAVSLNGGMGTADNAPQGLTNKGYDVVTGSAVETGVMTYFAEKPDHSYMVPEADFVEKVKSGAEMVVLDIRSAKDYEAGHVKGAVNLPWGSAIAENLTKIPQDKEVFIYCYTGQTAGQAVMTLNLAGINARSVRFGWNLGISKVDGVADVTETTANTLADAAYTVDADVAAAITDYYAGLSTIADERFKNYKVSEDDLKAMIDAGEDFYLLSIRKAEDYAAGHITGAKNIPYGSAMANSFVTLPTNKRVVVYCYTGQTAGQTTAALRLLGYDAVSLNGGVGTAANAPQGWTNKGYELVTE